MSSPTSSLEPPHLPQTLSPPSLPPPPNPGSSHLSLTPLSPTTSLLTIAGQTGLFPTDPNNPKNPHDQPPSFPADPISQLELALANVNACLKAVNATPRDIISVRMFVVKLEERKPWWEKYKEFVGEWRPPLTVLGVERLAREGLWVEVEVLGVVGRNGE